MAQPYVGEIRMFGGNFAPAGWMFCEGQLLPISENETLFNLIGTTYGGDGQETFALPNLSGRLPVHMGQGPGLQNYQMGELYGTESVTLTTSQITQIVTTNGKTRATPARNEFLSHVKALKRRTARSGLIEAHVGRVGAARKRD